MPSGWGSASSGIMRPARVLAHTMGAPHDLHASATSNVLCRDEPHRGPDGAVLQPARHRHQSGMDELPDGNEADTGADMADPFGDGPVRHGPPLRLDVEDGAERAQS